MDINLEKKVLAFKHVYELTEYFTIEWEKTPIDCKYAGMEGMPYAGVVLGIFKLETGTYLKTFTVYKSCYDTKDCYSHELSKSRLDSAKQMFAEYGLDHTKKIKSLLFSDKIDEGSYSLNLNGIKPVSSYENDYDNMLTKGFLHADDRLLFETHYPDNFAMASHGQAYYKAAYKKCDKVVFLIKFSHDNNMEGPRGIEFYHFTPLYTIKDNTH